VSISRRDKTTRNGALYEEGRMTARITEKEQRMSNEEKKKPKRNWGQNQANYLAALKGKQVTVVFANGKALKGELTGVDTYELFLRQANGLEVMISKGAVKYLHPAAVE